MREFKLTTTVDADQERVWALAADLRGYPRWHPLVERLKVDTGWSTRLKLLLRITRRVRLSGSILDWEPPQLIHWEGSHRVWGLLRVRYRLAIVPAGATTTVAQTVRVGGLLPRLVPALLSSLPDALAEAAYAFQHEVEGLQREERSGYRAGRNISSSS
jgi:hypothetical protein